MKKNWSNPEIKSLMIGCTNEQVMCPLDDEVSPLHGLGILRCPFFCTTHNKCGLSAKAQNKCPLNKCIPIDACGCLCNDCCSA